MYESDYLFLQSINQITDGKLLTILQRTATNLTVCPRCKIDDFVHVDSCELAPPNIQ